MLPNCFVIGAPRSGSTSLYEYLKSHPDVYMSPVKEPDFFMRPSLNRVEAFGTVDPRTLENDARLDAVLQEDLDWYLSLFEGVKQEEIRGEASAVYLGHRDAARHLARYLPDAKLITILRDPAERAHSHFVHAKRLYAEHGRTTAIGGSGRSLDDEFRLAVERAYHEGLPETAVSDPEIWLRSGLYFEHLTRFYSYFPREQIRVALFEDLVADARGLMADIFSFLKVDDSFALPTTAHFNASVVPRNREVFRFFTTRNALFRQARSLAPARARALAMRTRNRFLGGEKPAIDPDLRRKLVSIYTDDIRQLQILLDRDLSAWLR
jgi:hypothetical protein